MLLGVALGVLLLMIQPVRAQDEEPTADPEAPRIFFVPENSVDVRPPISAKDDDDHDQKLYWTLGGRDAAKFKIDGRGNLSFKAAPDYENPGTPVASTESLERRNTYEVTVRVGSGGQNSDPDPNDDYGGDDLAEIPITVNVTNVKEDGTVVFLPRQPQQGSEVRAHLTDPDGSVGGQQWQWASSISSSGPFTDIPELSTSSTYRPTAADVDKYLQVTVKYIDGAGGTSDKPNRASSDPRTPLKVVKDFSTNNAPPKFPDQNPLTDETTPDRDSTIRFVEEGSRGGTKVGAPVTAFDDERRIDQLTYLLGDRTESDSGRTSYKADKFRIDIETGQITVKPGAKLDYDGTDSHRLYRVKVTAIDGDNAPKSINVDIHVLNRNEGPTILRNYPADNLPSATGQTAGGRVPTEMSHPEVDRRSSKYIAVRNTLGDNTYRRNATIIDTDLDTKVVWHSNNSGQPADSSNGLQAAVYYAQDKDGGTETGELVWDLEGRDKDWLTLSEASGAGDAPTYSISNYDERVLAFKKAPDHEMPRGKPFNANSNNNVYEVTLVVTDENSGLKDRLPVTVKVIDSGEDNQPGRVKILNRQPEIGIELVAVLDDPDIPQSNVEWQWYRSKSTGGDQGEECGTHSDFLNMPPDPFADGSADGFRYFLDDHPKLAGDDINWLPIRDHTGSASGTGKRATYTPDYDGLGATGTPGTGDNANQVTWSGGDIGAVVTTNSDRTVDYSWTADSARCLRVAFTYKDATLVERTFKGRDNDPDDGVNQILEGAFAGSEHSVKRHDLRNKEPVFRQIKDDGTSPADTDAGTQELTYAVTKAEDATGITLAFRIAKDTISTPNLPAEVLPAWDRANRPPIDGVNAIGPEDEDDRTETTGGHTAGLGDDDDGRLTYSLSGDDAEHFVIVGSVDHPETYKYDSNDDGDTTDEGEFSISSAGQLSFKGGTKLDYDRPDDQREYEVTITATDPSGDRGSSSVKVVVTITDVNEAPEWKLPTPVDGSKVRHAENGKDPVATFAAENPEHLNPGPGVTYALVTTVPDGEGLPVAADIADHGQFLINSLTGALSFKSPPNFEDPKDINDDNEYHVAVKAVTTEPLVAGTSTIYRKIKVIVTNVNEAPKFTEDAFTLNINENINNLDNEPTPVRGARYLLNRGVGLPGGIGTPPKAPNLDLGIPVLAGDNDNTGTFAVHGSGADVTGVTTADTAKVDGLTYTLEGSADVLSTFTIVPATGQILTLKKLDYELLPTNRKYYEVRVKATDPDGDSATQNLTIQVRNVEDSPVPVTVPVSGSESATLAENSTGDALNLGEYSVYATGTDATPALSLGGPDVDFFELTSAGMLRFKASPDYENPRGKPLDSEDNTNTYKVDVIGTVSATQGRNVTDTLTVTVTVTPVKELGERLSGNTTASYTENAEGDNALMLGTYTLSEDHPEGEPVNWTVEAADEAVKALFAIAGTGTTATLSLANALDFEASPGEASSDDPKTKQYMVTVKAENGGEMEMVKVTVTFTDANELGTLTSPTIPDEYTENGTEALGTFTTDGPVPPTWTLTGVDAGVFDIAGGTLDFLADPDYENPADANGDNTYMVTVKAAAGSEMAMEEVTVEVTNAYEDGVVVLTGSPVVGATTSESVTASVTDPDIIDTDTVSWSWYRAATKEGLYDEALTAIGGATEATYTPVADDVGMFLGAQADYTDGFSPDYAFTPTAVAVRHLTIEGEPANIDDYPENGTAEVDTYTASLSDAVWSKKGEDADDFNLSSGGVLTFAASPNYEAPADEDTDNVYNVTVVATVGEATAERAVRVTVVDVNDAPVFAQDTATRSIAEDSDTGMDIGEPVTATDEDAGDTLSYSLDETGAKTFSIDANGQLKTNAPLDYETKKSYTVTVTTTDSEGATDTIAVTINVTDVAVENAKPVFTEGSTATRSIDENSAPGEPVGAAVQATDADEEDTLTYALNGDDAASFVINRTNGQIMTSAALDFETKSTYSVTITATDDSQQPNSRASIDVTINVTNVDEAGTLELSTMSPTVGVALTATLTDPDGYTAENVDWQWTRSLTMDGTFTHIDEETMSYTPTADDVGYYLKVVARYPDGQGPNKEAEATTGKVNAAPNPILIKFDTNGNGKIDRSEAIAALRSYRAGEATRSEAIAALRLYRES